MTEPRPTMSATITPARLKQRYLDEIQPSLVERFGYSTPMMAPKLVKVTLNMGLGEAKQDNKQFAAAVEQLATIAGQKPNTRLARKSIAQFKLREGMPIGASVTLRRERAYEFIDRLTSVALPRVRAVPHRCHAAVPVGVGSRSDEPASTLRALTARASCDRARRERDPPTRSASAAWGSFGSWPTTGTPTDRSTSAAP